MSEISEPISPAADPLASMSSADMAAAFASARPASAAPAEPAQAPEPAPAPVADAPVTPEPVAPTTDPAAPVEAPAPPAPAFDAAAYLREQFGVEQPDAIKTALDAAKEVETLRANQRTAEDIALAGLLADPAKGAAYLKLQTTDFKALSARELLAAEYAHDHPELPAELAAIEAELEYNAKYAAAEFEDADDPSAKAARLRLDYRKSAALTKLEGAKEAARTAVLRPNTPAAEGPSAEDTAQSTAWVSGVEALIAAPATEIAYTVDGQEVKLAFDNKSAAFREAALDPVAWLTKQVRPTGKYQETNYDRLAEIVALLTQPDVLAKNAFAAGKASVGPAIPIANAVNPLPNAPQPPASAQTELEAFRASKARQSSRQGNYLP